MRETKIAICERCHYKSLMSAERYFCSKCGGKLETLLEERPRTNEENK